MQRNILGMRLHASTYADVVDRVREWARNAESRSLCFSTVHMVMEGRSSPVYREVVNGADLVLPDGMPLVWCLRALGASGATRVYGPDTTERTLQMAAREGIPVGFHGSDQRTLEALVSRVRRRYPGIRIVWICSPPFRDVGTAEDIALTHSINASGVRILFVGLGCPKQEHWVAEHHGRIDAVMLAVGAAFDFLAGTKQQAPRWMMRAGLEWLFRLVSEPRRLWRRYLKHNPRFVVLFLAQMLQPRPTR